MDDLYRDYILEHYRRPHNFGVIEDPSASIEGSNPLCGDRITLQLGVRDGVLERVTHRLNLLKAEEGGIPYDGDVEPGGKGEAKPESEPSAAKPANTRK